jgi:hypothetical protein
MPKDEVLKRFDFGVKVTKAWVNKETGKHYVKAIASDTGVDHHEERFSEKALNQMETCIKENNPAPVILLPTHWDTFEIGKAVDARIINSPTHDELKALEVDIELDMEYPQAKSLYKEVESGNAQKQLSVGGHLDQDSDEPYYWEEKEYEMPDGNTLYDYVLVLNSLVLDHIAVTRKDQAANPRTSFSETFAKSWGIDKPPSRTINKEVGRSMPKENEKQAASLAELVAKNIREFFKSSTEDPAKTAAAERLAKAQAEMQAAQKEMEAFKSEGEEPKQEEGKDPIEEGVQEGAEKPANQEEADKAAQGEEGKEGDAGTAVDGAEKATISPSGKSLTVETPAVDVDALKASISEELAKSLNESQMETFKEIAKSLGDVIAETIKSQVAPLQNKIVELEKAAGTSKSLEGQEGIEATEVSKSDNEEEGNMWTGFLKGAIPQHIIAEKKYEMENIED